MFLASVVLAKEATKVVFTCNELYYFMHSSRLVVASSLFAFLLGTDSRKWQFLVRPVV